MARRRLLLDRPRAAPAREAPAEPSGSRRSRRLVTGIATAALGKGAGILVPLVLIPVTLRYVGADMYALWTAVTTVTAMAIFADLGLGQGLMTRLAPCYATGDAGRARRYISTAYVLLGAVALGGCAALWLLADVIPWRGLFNAAGAVSAADARDVSLVCLTVFVVNIPLSLVTRVLYAYQRVGQNNLWQAAGYLCSLPLVLGAVAAGLPPVAVVAASVLWTPLTNVAASAWLYRWAMPHLRPGWRHVDRGLAGDLHRLGGLFFAGNLLMALALNADPLLVAHTVGLGAVVAYAVPARVFNQLGGFAGLVNLPLWSANGDALARGELRWVRRTVVRASVLSGVVALVPSVVLVVAGNRLFTAWLGTPMGDDRALLVGLGAWSVLLAVTSPLLMVQNAAGLVRPQLLAGGGYLVLSVAGKWWAARAYGVAAVPYVSTLAYLCTLVPAALYGYHRVMVTARRIA
ncbi:lipopolysaccharide biosynthesis protein [Micromonospora okii]|uniref:lipopolysaccharide biosynthesis protein n=1 Tax=Micromonospora okii TaxID=1182970 RepID=UPI001E5EBAE2|nr:oligosaccharide flippase family protein [Micromonospora okii]